MTLGLPWWIGAGDAEDGIDLALETGYDLVEISLDHPWPDELEPLSLADAAEDAGVELGFHAPWRTQALAHPREELARAAREVAQNCLAAARAAGGSYLVFHVDARGFSGYPRGDVVQAGLESAHASLRALSRSAGEDLDVLVENTTTPLGLADEVDEFLDPLPNVGFCLDPGHAAIAARRADAAIDFGAWMEHLGDRLELVHLMDFAETESRIVDHLLPGAGEADLESIVQQARSAGCSRLLVEAFRADREGSQIGPDDWQSARKRIESW